ncbi:MAG TPA: glycogen debranching N-terminal domain-containing protein [Cellulomonas sp.]
MATPSFTPFGLTDDAQVPLPPGTVASLVEGSSFCASSPNGDIEPGEQQGLFVRDTRLISEWRLLVDGAPLQPLATVPAEPFEGTFVCRAAPRPGHDDATVIVQRRRFVSAGMREDVTVRNYGTETAGLRVTLEVDADFADLFQVKEGRGVNRRAHVHHDATGSDLHFWFEHEGVRRGVRIAAPGADGASRVLSFRVVIPAQSSWTTTIEVLPSLGGAELAAAFPAHVPVENTAAAVRMRSWRDTVPRITVDNRLFQLALDQSERDLGALRIVDLDHPEDDVVAAGAPWFMALFGRDSLIASWMAMSVAPNLALGTLRTLARMQGKRVDPMTEEEPGRILHEVRVGMDLTLALGGESVYYGSIDSTPLFVMLVDEAARWGVPIAEIAKLMPAVDAALDWMRDYGDRDGDGFLEYGRSTDRGLLHQGWKDSHDGISFADGTLAVPPIALAEVQGYAYGAYRARAHLAGLLGDPTAARTWTSRAAELRTAFDRAFWIPDKQRFALALDHEKRQVDSLVSNMGQCLWSGIVLPERAPAVVAALLSRDLFTGFGIRTLGLGMAMHNPVSYHNGSVWPHDTTLAASGLARYGFVDECLEIVDGLLDASAAFGSRLPELFCGFDRRDTGFPVPYPAACTPQAWAAAAPFHLLRTLLRLDPCVPHHTIHVSPVPASLGHVRMDGVPFADTRLSIEVDTTEVHVDGLPPGARVSRAPEDHGCDRFSPL